MFPRLNAPRIVLTASLLWSCHASFAQQATFTPNATILNHQINYVVQADGRYTKEEIAEVRINTDQGVKERGQLHMPYSTTLQEIKIIKAYSITPDGRRMEVKPEEIREQQSPVSAEAPMFDDQKVKVVIFPAVAIGARLGIHTQKIQKTPLFKGFFYDLEAAWPNSEFKSFKISIQAPRSMKLQVLANQMNGGEISPSGSEQQVWQWSQENIPAVAQEMAATSPHERIPHVAMTNFANYNDAAKAYLERAQAKSAVTPGIQKLADEITHGVTDRRQQAQALYQWVNHNIRYVAIFLGFGGVVPHEAQAIADARYGDCKDKTTLLQALLAAKGIASSTALINATDVYWLPSIAMPTTAFNHAITYIPEFDVFLDATPGKAMFGVLSPQLLGKTALVIQNAQGEPELKKLPIAQTQNHGVNIYTTLQLNDQGDIRGQSQVEPVGTLDLLSRLIFRSLPPGVEPQLASQLLTMSGLNGSGTLVHEGEDDTSKPFKFKTEFQLPGYAQLPGPGAMVMPSGLNGFFNIASTLAVYSPEQRQLPMTIMNGTLREEIRLAMPAGIQPKLPAPTTLKSPIASYSSRFSQQGQTLIWQRELALHAPSAVLQPAQYQEMRHMATAITRSLRSQILY